HRTSAGVLNKGWHSLQARRAGLHPARRTPQMDFSTPPTLTFRCLYCLFAISAFLKAPGLMVKRTSAQAAWQNGIAERWIRSCRLVITPGEQHLRRLMRDYVNYHYYDGIHDPLTKDTRRVRGTQPRAGRM